MPSANDIIVHSLTTTQQLLNQYLADFRPEEYLHRPCAQANCAAWILGHLILIERSALGVLRVASLPALPAGFEKQFARDAAAAADFGDVSILLPLFNQHREQMIAAARNATAGDLDRPLEKPHPRFKTVAERINGVGIHAMMHAGQITIIRRSLGRPPMM